MRAWHSDSPAVIRALVAAGAEVNARDKARNRGWSLRIAGREESYTPLHYAAKYNDSPGVIEALVGTGADVNARTELGDAPLHLATWHNDNPGVVEALLEAGAEVNAGKGGDTPLHHVARDDNPAIIESLLEAGAEVNARDQHGLTPLHGAALHTDNILVIEALLDAGAEVNSRSESGKTPLHEAVAWNDNPAVTGALVAAGADVNARDEEGNTPLHRAAEYNDNPAIIEFLLDTGASVSVRNRNNRVPWDYARAQSELEGSDALQRLRTLTLARECAAWNTSEFFLSALPARVADCLEAGKRANARVEDRTALHWAVAHDADLDIIRTLVDAGVDVNARTRNGHTPLHFAPSDLPTRTRRLSALQSPQPQWYYTAVIKILVEAGADVNARSNTGETPLHWAASPTYDNATGVLVLVEAGADVNTRDEDGETPLYLALLHDNLVSALVLVAAGADVNAKDRRGETPLHQVFRGEDKPSLTLIKALLAAGANVNFQNEVGWTPLYWAVSRDNSLAIVEVLRDAGAEVNIPGHSPLHRAAKATRNPAVVGILLDAGADASARDGDGKTPWDYAQDNEALRGTDVWWRLREGRFR